MSPSTTTRSSKASPATRSPRIDKSRLSWTATRCHRLLRPLQNRIAALRREIYAQERTFPHIHPENLNGSAKLSQKRKIAEGEQLHETKRPCRTYSKKQATGADCVVGTTRWGHGDRPRTLGGPMPQTPIFRRTKLVKAEKDVSTQASKDGQGTRNRSSRSMSYSGNPTQSGPLIASIGCLRKAHSPVAQHRYVHYESMLRILDTLLRATATPDSVSNQKSLLHMCLRKIPDDLEQMSGSDAGWKYFASLVRAHALWVIREAITEGLIEPVFAGIIAHHYNQLGYTDDASTILETTAERTYPAPRSLRTMASRLSRSTSSLLSSRQLPAEWLSTKALSNLWKAASWAVSEPRTSIYALQHASAAIASLACLTRSPPRSQCITMTDILSTLASVVGGLVAMSVAAQGHRCFAEAADGKTSHVKNYALHRVVYVLHEALARSTRRKGNDDALYMLELAIFVVSAAGFDNVHAANDGYMLDVRKHWPRGGKGFPKTLTVGRYNVIAGLACSIARASARTTSVAPHHFFSQLCDRFEEAGLPGLESLRQDGAFLLAHKTHDLRDLAFAECMSTVVSGPNHSVMEQNCVNKATFVGYRWEEGISEWVVASPKRPCSRYPMAGAKGPAGRRRRGEVGGTVQEVFAPTKQQICTPDPVVTKKQRAAMAARPKSKRQALGDISGRQPQAQARASDDELGF
ncbi:hypothetical protein BN1708_010871 [Verticillium longisporum]|uniref:Uncharacterized protein n=1 Tax=Verticillium longisporum TaxID=100787 RepID=A0A0G4KUV6_VERLO|nr:hypothetical protein BN1708_010871 [Verticillium longisporum]